MKVRRLRGPPRQRIRPAIALQGMWAFREEYVEGLRQRNYSKDTVRAQASDIRRFLEWCDERSLVEATDVTQPVVERYQRWLFYHRSPDGRPLSFRSQHHLLCSMKAFFRWLTKQHLTLFNPAAEIELPKVGRRLPRDILTAAEGDWVINQADVTDSLGVRDRAILETFYATGIRRRSIGAFASSEARVSGRNKRRR